MKYSLWNFRDWLTGCGISLSYYISDNDANIEHIRLSNEPPDYSEPYASIIDGNVLPDCSGFRSALCFRNNRLLFPVASTEQILNLSMDMMEYYDKMEAALFEQLASGSSIPELLESAATMTGFPMAYLSDTRSFLIHSSNWEPAFTSSLKKELLRQVNKRNQVKAPFYYITDPSSLSGTIVAKSLQTNSNHGYVLLYDLDGSFRPGDAHIFSAAVDVIRKAVLLQSFQPALSRHPLTDWFRKSLSASRPAEIDPSLLDQVKWDRNDYYQIACFVPRKPDDGIFSDFFQTAASNDFCNVQTSDGSSVLIHLGKEYPASLSKTASSLESFCTAHNCQIGFSQPFHTLSEIREYYQQSVDMLSLCKETSIVSIRMSEHISEHILEKCSSLPGIQAYIHPDIRTLSEIERRDNEPLLETLYTYLILGRSASHAAQLLFVHRNTMRMRLKKIQHYLSFSIEEDMDIRRILISLMIAKKTGRSN